MSEEADFEIDFYGDDAQDTQQPEQTEQPQQQQQDGDQTNDQMDDVENGQSNKEAPQQGTKRKSEDVDDSRPVDPGATAAIMISELSWWTTDDDIRGWLRKAGCEDQAKELTFSEHKVNGKSKGQAYVEFTAPQDAMSAKRQVEQVVADASQTSHKNVTVSYWNPGANPFRTLPKDAPARVKEQPRAAPSGPYNDRGGYGGGGGYRGRGGMNGGRGNMQGNYNRNYNNNNNMGYNNFNNNMGGGNFGFNRGGMMGNNMRGNMRGGRGGNNMMGMNPMNMGMPMGMPMGMMGGGMPGFQGMNPNFNPANFGFQQNQGGAAGGGGMGGGNAGQQEWGNPHGAKRPRPE